MSKTFSNAGGNRDIRVIEDSDRGFVIRAVDHIGVRGIAVAFNNDTAPALALAILEAAVGESSRQSAYSERAIDNLRSEVDRMTLEDAEAKDKAKLEAEALEFLHVAQKYNNFTLTESWNDFRDGGTKLLYMNMARRARELNKEEK